MQNGTTILQHDMNNGHGKHKKYIQFNTSSQFILNVLMHMTPPIVPVDPPNVQVV